MFDACSLRIRLIDYPLFERRITALQSRLIVKLSNAALLLTLCLGVCYPQTSSPPQEQAAYYFGEAKITSPTGQPFGSTLSLVKRILKPAENRIIEQVVFLDPRRPAEEHITVLDVKGSALSIKDEGGSFTGEGELQGKAWEWNSWKSNVKFTDGKGTLKSEDTLTGNGIQAKKWFYRPDGKVSAVITEELKPISKEAYELLRSKLLQK